LIEKEELMVENSVRVLLVEDEEKMRELIKIAFKKENFETIEATEGKQGLNLFKTNQVDIVILDIMLPEIDGWTVCREIRRISNVPIILLTARGEEFDKLFGFELGVDDYIIKPFSPKELLARTKAILRRSEAATAEGAAKAERVSLAGLVIEFNSRNVYVDGKIVSLTPKEYELLKFFVKNQNRVFSREQLLNSIWGYDFTGDDRTVDTHVKMLRERLGSYRKFIVTVWGTGYKFETGEKK
jgi:DNA-binding response OmpR family regulator